MLFRVVADDVSCGQDCLGYIWPLPNIFSNREESCSCIMPRQDIEKLECVRIIWAVIKGKGDLPCIDPIVNLCSTSPAMPIALHLTICSTAPLDPQWLRKFSASADPVDGSPDSPKEKRPRRFRPLQILGFIVYLAGVAAFATDVAAASANIRW